MKTIKQTITFNSTPHQIFEMLMDSKKHSNFTQAGAKISRKVGGKISAYDGYIEGENLEDVKDKKIVQLWRGSDWPEGHFSTSTFQLKMINDKTRLAFTQTNVPDAHYKSISKGWVEHYWNKMEKMLEK